MAPTEPHPRSGDFEACARAHLLRYAPAASTSTSPRASLVQKKYVFSSLQRRAERKGAKGPWRAPIEGQRTVRRNMMEAWRFASRLAAAATAAIEAEAQGSS